MADESHLNTDNNAGDRVQAQSGTASAGDQASYTAPELERTSSDPSTEDGHTNLESILEIPVKLSMEIGQTRISIRNLLQLTRGSVVEFDKDAGEPLDVMVNGILIAHGEVVVVNDKFGVRLTDVVSARERVNKLA